MTWNELAEKISKMPAEQKERDVLLIDGYDKPNRRAVVLAAVKAHEDVYAGFGIGSELVLLNGDLYLKDEKWG